MTNIEIKFSDMTPLSANDFTGNEWFPVFRPGDKNNYIAKMSDVPGTGGGDGNNTTVVSDVPHPFLFSNSRRS